MKFKNTHKQYVHLVLILGLVTFCTLFPDLAHAAGKPWETGTQRVLDALNSGTARSLAIIAVMGLGLAGLAKKMSWIWAGSIIAGIVLIFGAPAFVDFFQ